METPYAMYDALSVIAVPPEGKFVSTNTMQDYLYG